MRRSYASLLHFQEGWSSLQRPFHMATQYLLRTHTEHRKVKQSPNSNLLRKCAQKMFKSPRTAEGGLTVLVLWATQGLCAKKKPPLYPVNPNTASSTELPQ